MSAGDPETQYDVTPEAALVALRAHEGPVLLDLDETLYLRNSTEDFIDSARPGIMAALLLRILDALGPWRWTGGEATRDVWRLGLVLGLFPWVKLIWRRRTALLAARFGNQPLIAALEARHTPPIVVTVGFHPIVAPLVAALGLSDSRLVAARAWSFEDRRGGKLRLASAALGDETVRRGLVITDSTQDLPLLDACARPLRTLWPGARYRPALSAIYLPGQYLARVKRPGQQYVARCILREDFALWVLSSIAVAATPALHVLGLLILLVSFWAIYERGYRDNDMIAERFETDPQLSPAFRDSQVATPRLAAWLWALGCGATAIVLLRWPSSAAPGDFVTWVAVLAATSLWFWLYNRFDKATRVWLYWGLQLSRSAAFVALLPIVPIGAVAIGAHVLARWVPYYMYRCGKGWPDAPVDLMRLLFFGLLSTVMAMAEGPSILANWTALALLGFNLLKARRDLRAVVKSSRRLDRPAQASGSDRRQDDAAGIGQVGSRP